MELLCVPKGVEFSKKTNFFNLELTPYQEWMFDKIQTDPIVQGNSFFVNSADYFGWPIRKLEYSYANKMAKGLLKEGAVVLDAGCGVTPFHLYLASKGCSVHAIDIDNSNIELLTYLFGKESDGNSKDVTYHVGGIKRLIYPDNFFDAIFSISVFEHISFPEYLQVLAELYRVLRVGGRLILTVDVLPDNDEQIKITKRDNPDLIMAFTKTDIEELISNYHDELIGYSGSFPNITEEMIGNFWQSHLEDGAAFGNNRGYTSVGITIEKEQKKTTFRHNMSLSQASYLKQLQQLNDDQYILDLILLDAISKENKLLVTNPQFYLDENERSLYYLLWGYRQIIAGLDLYNRKEVKILSIGEGLCPVTFIAVTLGYNVTVMVGDLQRIDILNKDAKSAGRKNVSFVPFDISSMSTFEDETFDLAISSFFMTAHKSADQKEIVHQTDRLLKPGGVFAFTFDYGIPIDKDDNNFKNRFHEPPRSVWEIKEIYLKGSELQIIGNDFTDGFSPLTKEGYFTVASIFLGKRKDNGKFENVHSLDRVGWELEKTPFGSMITIDKILKYFLSKTIVHEISENGSIFPIGQQTKDDISQKSLEEQIQSLVDQREFWREQASLIDNQKKKFLRQRNMWRTKRDNIRVDRDYYKNIVSEMKTLPGFVKIFIKLAKKKFGPSKKSKNKK